MKLAITIAPVQGDWDTVVTYIQEAERLGVDSAWTAETWGFDAATPLAYIAAKTTRLRLGTGIMQVGARTPAMVAMTALSLASLTRNRFMLGLGVSGPQVMEGWHGIDFTRPLQRLRETVAIVRMVARGERLSFQGEMYQLPLPGGEGKALVPTSVPQPDLPIYLATLGPKSLELTGEVADGWLGTSFMPEHADLFLGPLAAGAARVDRPFSQLDLCVAAGVVAFSDDLERLIAPRKPGLAFTLGAMGSRTHNFYNDVYRRAGYEDIVAEVQNLWLAKRREEAAARVPDELVLQTNLLGTEAMVKARVRKYRDVGITTLRVEPDGQTLQERLHNLARLADIVHEVANEQ